MSFAGRAVSSNGCVTKPKGRELGLTGFAVQIRPSSLTGSYVMATAEHREPYESRGSRTVLGAPGGESPPGDSSKSEKRAQLVRYAFGKRTSHPASLQSTSSDLLLQRRLAVLVGHLLADGGDLGANLVHNPLVARSPRRHARQGGQRDTGNAVD